MGRKKKVIIPAVTQAESRILKEAFSLLYVLSPSQVCKLLYSAGSLRGVEKYMTNLVKNGVLRRIPFSSE